RTAGGEAEAILIDVSKADDIEKMVGHALDRFGALHILVNNVWGSKEPDGSAEDLTETGWDYAMEVGLKSIFRAVKRAVPHIRASGGGSIVNIASVHGLLMAPEKLAYETVKSAVIGMTKQMACDFGPDGIRVNAICPGHIVTERGQAHWENNPGLHGLFVAQYPVRRTGVPDDIANAIRFLVSEEASFITGHTLVVDGGLTIQLQENLGVAQAKYLRDHPDIDLP
ncbi:MAG TPA: SDR family oxidoreductase, partial [candidate division Zixibacteria bacterium]|nr:SDR family oxidoreductase [candidate division Zixibacteria bacterium]